MRIRLQDRIEKVIKRAQVAGVTQPTHEQFAIGTTVGTVRTQNQDRVAVMRYRTRTVGNKPVLVGVLCDGMGGMNDGERCAEIAISSFLSSLVTLNEEVSLKFALERAVHVANEQVYSLFQGKGGSTLSAFLFSDGSLSIVNVGDSRIYGISHDSTVNQLTTDDTLSGHLAVTKPESPERLLFHRRLVQFVGMGDDIEPHVTIITVSLKGILITSDGAHSFHRSVFDSIVKAASTPRALVERLVNLSIYTGGRDNATVLAASLSPTPRLSEKEIDSDLGVIEIWTTGGIFEIYAEGLFDISYREQLNAPQTKPEVVLARTDSSTTKTPRKRSSRTKKAKSVKSKKIVVADSFFFSDSLVTSTEPDSAAHQADTDLGVGSGRNTLSKSVKASISSPHTKDVKSDK